MSKVCAISLSVLLSCSAFSKVSGVYVFDTLCTVPRCFSELQKISLMFSPPRLDSILFILLRLVQSSMRTRKLKKLSVLRVILMTPFVASDFLRMKYMSPKTAVPTHQGSKIFQVTQRLEFHRTYDSCIHRFN